MTFKAKATSYFRYTRVTSATCDGLATRPLRATRRPTTTRTKLLNTIQKVRDRARKEANVNSKFIPKYRKEKHEHEDRCTDYELRKKPHLLENFSGGGRSAYFVHRNSSS